MRFPSARRRDARRPLDQFEESSLFAQDEPFALRERKVRAAFRIGFESRPIRLVRGEAVARDQPPSHVVRTLMRQKIADEVTSATRNDARPVLGVLLEGGALKGIDLVPDETSCSMPGWSA